MLPNSEIKKNNCYSLNQRNKKQFIEPFTESVNELMIRVTLLSLLARGLAIPQ